MKKVRTRLITISVWVIALVIIAILIQAYTVFVSARLYDEAKRNFSEVCEQVDQNFLAFMEDTWKNLEDWGPYLGALDDTGTADYIEQRRVIWGFSDFLFLNSDGTGITLEGKIISVNLGPSHTDLYHGTGEIMAEWDLDKKTSEAIFATAIEPSVFRNFRYDAIAVTYTNEDLASTIRTKAFSGEAIGFVITADGAIELSTQEGGNVYSNYLTYLSAGSDLDEQQLSDLRRAWESGEEGVLSFKLDDVEYYLSYQPLGYGDYILLEVVPADVVSGALRTVQEATIDVLLKVFLIIAAILAVQGFLVYRRRAKRSKVEIEYRDALFDLLSANLDDIFIVIDADTLKVSYITPNVQRLLGVSPEAVEDDLEPLRKSLANEDGVVDGKLLHSIELGERYELVQEWVNQEDGTQRWFREAIYRLQIQDEEKYIIILSDRTEDRKMARNLEDALETAKEANTAKSRFLSNMSHDIRTPMNAIMGFTELLDVNADDPERVRDYVRKIHASSSHLLSLINDVLDMSKIESGKTELSLAEFSLPDLIEGVTTIMAPQAEAKEQTFDVRVEGDPGEYFMGDKLRINQILINLLSNAVKYTQVGGHVEFIVEKMANPNPNFENIRFTVTDNGMGMSEDYLKVVFDPFTREEGSGTNTVQGTGLGMAITKSLVDLMGGVVEVESEVGKGTTFTVEITVAKSTELKSAGATGAHGEDTEVADDVMRGLNILAAEDNDLSAEMLIDRLDMEGAKIVRARDGAEAVGMFEASAPGEYDLILMDVQMPVMGGYDATRAIRRSDHPDAQTIPIFAMTANVFAEDVRNAFDAGMDAHIPKPIEIKELRRVTDRMLNRHDEPKGTTR